MSDRVFYGLVGLLVLVGAVFGGLLVAGQIGGEGDSSDWNIDELPPEIAESVQDLAQLEVTVTNVYPVSYQGAGIEESFYGLVYRMDESAYCVVMTPHDKDLDPRTVILTPRLRDGGEWRHDLITAPAGADWIANYC